MSVQAVRRVRVILKLQIKFKSAKRMCKLVFERALVQYQKRETVLRRKVSRRKIMMNLLLNWSKGIFHQQAHINNINSKQSKKIRNPKNQKINLSKMR